jgi:hypothetical protein
MKKLALTAVLAFLSASAFSAVPGESAYCLANCVTGICQAAVAKLGQTNFQIGLPLEVPVVSPGNTMLVPATSYGWNFLEGPHGTPSAPGLTADATDSYVFAKVSMSDSGLYAEEGFAAGGSLVFNWCLTVNPIAVLNPRGR